MTVAEASYGSDPGLDTGNSMVSRNRHGSHFQEAPRKDSHVDEMQVLSYDRWYKMRPGELETFIKRE